MKSDRGLEVSEAQKAFNLAIGKFVGNFRVILEQVEAQLASPEIQKTLALKASLPSIQIRLEGCTFVITRFPLAGRPDLSQRQRELLEFLVNGLARREIAEKLNISARTVDTHFDRLLEKLGVDNRVELIRWAECLLS